MLIVCGTAELLIFCAPIWWERVQRRRRERADRTPGPPGVFREEVVGELFASPVLPRRAAPRPPRKREVA